MLNEKLYQIIPSEVCFSCDVCCRFLEEDSPLAPIFTSDEKEYLISQGADLSVFRSREDEKSSQIKLIPSKDYYICPFFETETNKCSIYANRPLDCQLYPFVLMSNKDKSCVQLGIDMLCPYSEKYFETDVFQHHLQSIIDYIETDDVMDIITTHPCLIGAYQDTVKVFHSLNQDLHYAPPSSNA